MRTALTIAKNTFRQAIRDKILYGIIIFALLFIGSSVVLSSLSLGEDVFIIRNFGLAGIYLFGIVITIFLGASIVYKEVEEKITYLLLAKPVTRADIIWGKFLGLLMAIGTTVLLMVVAYLLIVLISGGIIDYAAITAVILQLAEVALLISVLIMFSIFTTPLAATIYTILILYIGHLLPLVQEFALKSGKVSKFILLAVYYIFPNLEKFNVRNLVVHNLPISFNEVVIPIIYSAAYVTLALLLAQKLLNRRDM